MKQFFFILCTLFIFTSCLDNYESHTTPAIGTSEFICNSTDTLYVKVGTKGYELDTIAVGDTVRFSVAFDARGNKLLTASVVWDTTYVDFYISNLGEIRDIMAESSDSANCILNFSTDCYGIYLPYTMIAKKAGAPALTFEAVTDSKFSPVEIKLTTPIK